MTDRLFSVWRLRGALCLGCLACCPAAVVRPDAPHGRDPGFDYDESYDEPDQCECDGSPVDNGSTEAGSAVVGRLPSPRHEAAVFSDGKVVYAAGGLDSRRGFLTEILRFAPVSGKVTVLPETLPNPTQAAGVGWTGEAAYLFGGRNGGGFLTQIVRYRPSKGEVTLMKATLPTAGYSLGVAWTGKVFYLFGGFTGVDSNQILRYDPQADVLTVLPATMPFASQAPGAFWDGKGAWILGGASNGASDHIQFFDPASGRVTEAGRLPCKMWVPAGFYDGSIFYLAGGASNRSGYASILRFDPHSGQATTISTRLPFRLGGRIATWVASAGCAYLVGGQDPPGGALLDTIIRVVP